MAHGHRLDLVMGHVQRRGAQTPLQLHDLGAGAGAQLGVEVAEWFIHQEHRRLPRDGAPQGHPLLLPPRELLGPAGQQGFELQGRRHCSDALGDAFLSHRGHPQGGRQGAAQAVQAVLQLGQGPPGCTAPQPEADVVGHAQVGIQGVALEHHGHVAGCRAQPAHRPSAHEDLTGGGLLQACQQSQQGAFAAPRGAHQHQELTIVDAEVELLQHRRGLLTPRAIGPGRVGLADLLEANVSQSGAPTALRRARS